MLWYYIEGLLCLTALLILFISVITVKATVCLLKIANGFLIGAQKMNTAQ